MTIDELTEKIYDHSMLSICLIKGGLHRPTSTYISDDIRSVIRESAKRVAEAVFTDEMPQEDPDEEEIVPITTSAGEAFDSSWEQIKKNVRLSQDLNPTEFESSDESEPGELGD